MKDRLVTLGLAIGAFALFYALFVPKPAGVEDPVALPVSTESRDAGYQGLWRWLQAQRIPVVSFRDRFDRLAERAPADTGNVLIVTMPQQQPIRNDEATRLDQWLERGNTLLVLAALDDTPAWALRSASDFLTLLTRVTRLQFNVVEEEEEEEEEVEEVAADADVKSKQASAGAIQKLQGAVQQIVAPPTVSIVARGSHPLFAGVRSVATKSDYPASRWTASSMDSSAVLEIGERADLAAPGAQTQAAMWLKHYGQGQIIVLGFASPFSNGLIGQQDNARLFANIIAWSRAGGGALLFDDAHQGLVNYYDAKKFFADPRLHRSLLWICALWLVFVLGWQRLRPHTEGWNPVDVTTFIKATGSFFAGKVAPNLVGQRLCENFFNGVRQRLALPQDGMPVWGWLEAHASISAQDLDQLRRLHERTHSRRNVDLIQLQNCLKTITGSIK